MGLAQSTDKSKKLQEIDNYPSQTDIYDISWLEAIEKSFIFVWCDASIGTSINAKDDKNTITELARVVNKNRQLVHTFNDLHACREFITHVNNVCLVISGTMGEELVPLIHNHEQIHSIYIFCINKSKHEAWALQYHKVREVCTDIRAICESLKSYIISQSSIDYDRLEFNVINNENKLAKTDTQEIILIYSILSKTILLNINSSDHGKQDMINYCRSEYTSEYQIQLINDFERNYSQHNPVWWYTRNCFFQGIINRALRTYDLYTLCSMHRFIKDLSLKLSQLYENQKTSKEPLNLYFGQFLSPNDFNKLNGNHGGLMCMNQFICANPEQGIAVMFIKQQNASVTNENKVRVLFRIHIDRTIESNVSYANIGAISDFVHEKEHLISMSSIYRIDKVEALLDISPAWLVQLTLIGRNDLQYTHLTKPIQPEQLEIDFNLPELGCTIMKRLHSFKSANKSFKQASNTNKEGFKEIILHYNMAIIYDVMNEYERSLIEYRSAIDIARRCIPSCYQKDDLCLIPLYSNMGLTYQHANKHNNAMDHAFRALAIITNAVPIDSIFKKELISSCYYNLGLIHEREGKLNDARNFYEHALRYRQEHLPLGHPDITMLKTTITLLSTKK